MKVIALILWVALTGTVIFWLVLIQIYWSRANYRPFCLTEMHELQRIVELHSEPHRVIADLKKMLRSYYFSRFHLFKSKSAYQHIMEKVQQRIQKTRSPDEVEACLHIKAILLQLMDGVPSIRVRTLVTHYNPKKIKIYESH